MYAMTAAHPTLPIPSYARIRNPGQRPRGAWSASTTAARSIAGRIVDLSYTAALKLDLLRGVAPVELERITFDDIRTGAWRDGGDADARRRRRSRRRSAAAMPPVDGRTAAVAPGLRSRYRRKTSRSRSDVAGRLRRHRSHARPTRRRAASGSSSAPSASATAPRAFAAASAPTTRPAGSRRCSRSFADAALYRVQAGPYREPRRGRGRGAARARGARARAGDRRAAMTSAAGATGALRQAILFTGHMVDAPGSRRCRAFRACSFRRRRGASRPRLPRSTPGRATSRSRKALPAATCCSPKHASRAACRCACCCRSAKASSSPQSLLPVEDGAAWQARFRAVVARLDHAPSEAPQELGALAAGEDPFVRGNLWLLASARAVGAERLCCICLWDGGGGDGPGGTRHLVEAVRDAGGTVLRIDTRTL